LRFGSSSEERQKVSAQPQEEFGLSEADTTIKYAEKALLGRAKLRIEIEHPFSYLRRFIQVRVGSPMSQRPESFASGPSTTGSQVAALIEQT
jgi:hypothetical protein